MDRQLRASPAWRQLEATTSRKNVSMYAARLQWGPRILLAQAGALRDVHDQARGRRQRADAHVLQRGRQRAAPGAHRNEQGRADRLRRVRGTVKRASGLFGLIRNKV